MVAQIPGTPQGDPRILRLISRMLKAGVMEDGLVCGPVRQEPPQGSILSPLLSNIYLHYALDLVQPAIQEAMQRRGVLLSLCR